MASADLRKELECSVCLSTYTDPVTLKCGHNFCRSCIRRVLDTQEGGCSCPECREKFPTRPVLHRNITLCNIVENFLSAQPDQESSGVYCTHCIHTPVPAVKFCLHCEASLCDNHLRVHSKSPEHILCDPTTSLENRKCPIHKQLLKYYCTEDGVYICVSCRLDGAHQGHKVETLYEASESEMKKKLKNVLQKLTTESEETEKRLQRLQEHRRQVQSKAYDETESITALFTDLRRRLDDLEKSILSEISRQVERVALSLSDMSQKLDIKKDELFRKMGRIEELCHMTDLLTAIQESDTRDLCDTKNGDEDRESRDNEPLYDAGDLDVEGILHTLHTGLSDIMSEVNVQKYTGTHVYPHSTTTVDVNAEPSRRRPQPIPSIKRSHRQAGQQASRMAGLTDILLDVNTAGNGLQISEDRRTATRSSDQDVPDTPSRFQCNQVLSSQGFSSGRLYWEVDVTGSAYWTVGMCYPTMERKGGNLWIGSNDKSWGFERIGNNQHSVVHDNNRIRLQGIVSSNKVRVDLDYEAGWISFYDMCVPIRHLHTFTTTFTEPLHAGLWLGGGSLKVCGGNHL
ncbi:E3 ubiquitin/ISG15 ligase TRIM25-like [Rana temporaria]|uniref:E3 ubiquitin/ISG15 ligase TRIM25-like n=1 Tax=Rana temporaria TaxID=8407 RepID=UPI001AAC7F7C|nr:E3 ubiquitin/ISG15 ligase TRIM25-like [Rana temporaria]